ncbi:MAG TPA: hypothetical protein VEL11_04320, partial [Candidatus Bathyarchaeia archaeon]|nr:hypothetical protein [Candidatus Bathyarchaeia archaeon]
TYLLRGLCLLLPLPCANNTIPLHSLGTARLPSRVTLPAATLTDFSLTTSSELFSAYASKSIMIPFFTTNIHLTLR